MIVGLHVLLHFARLNTRAAFFALSHQAATAPALFPHSDTGLQVDIVAPLTRRVGGRGGFGRLATMAPHFRFSSRWCSLADEV